MSEQQVRPSPSISQRTGLVGAMGLLMLAAAMVLVATHRRYAGMEVGDSTVQTMTASPEQIEKLTAGLRAADSGLRLESAVGLLQLGRMEGGRALLELSADAEGSVRRAAAIEFGRVARPAGEVVGAVVDWPVGADILPTAAQINSARVFWEQRATPTLLRDVQARLAGTDHRWTELNRMLALRDRLYRMSGTDPGDRTP